MKTNLAIAVVFSACFFLPPLTQAQTKRVNFRMPPSRVLSLKEYQIPVSQLYQALPLPGFFMGLHSIRVPVERA